MFLFKQCLSAFNVASISRLFPSNVKIAASNVTLQFVRVMERAWKPRLLLMYTRMFVCF